VGVRCPLATRRPTPSGFLSKMVIFSMGPSRPHSPSKSSLSSGMKFGSACKVKACLVTSRIACVGVA
jgi:hypothetical protein